MFEFDYTISEKDYYEFNRYHALHSPVGKKSRRIITLIIPFVFLIQLLIDIMNGRTENIVGIAIVYLLYSLVWTLMVGFLIRLSLRMNTKFLKKNGKLPYDNQIELRFDEDFIYEKAPLTEIKMSYAKLERVAVGKEGVYLYHTVMSAFVMPNKVFTNTAQKYDFLQFMHQKTNLTISDMLS